MTSYVIMSQFNGDTFWLKRLGRRFVASRGSADAVVFSDAGYAHFLAERRNYLAQAVAELRGTQVVVWRVAEYTAATYQPVPDRHEREAEVFALRRAVVIAATREPRGYCGGQSEKAEYHVDRILPALCEVLGIDESELVALRKRKPI